MRTLGDRLCWARERRGLSQAELARRSGADQATISTIERGQTVRSLYTPVFAAVLQVHPLWLAEGTGEVDMAPETDPTPVRQLFAAALVYARAEAGFADAKALSKACGLPAPRLADLEAARAEPSLDELYVLSRATGLSLDRLFGLVGRPVDAPDGMLHEGAPAPPPAPRRQD